MSATTYSDEALAALRVPIYSTVVPEDDHVVTAVRLFGSFRIDGQAVDLTTLEYDFPARLDIYFNASYIVRLMEENMYKPDWVQYFTNFPVYYDDVADVLVATHRAGTLQFEAFPVAAIDAQVLGDHDTLDTPIIGVGAQRVVGSRQDDFAVVDAAARVFGGDGRDVFLGFGEGAWMDGGRGDDALFGTDGDDWLRGGDGGDHLDGRDGTDTLIGGRGDDTLSGYGADTLLGGAGDDVMTLTRSTGLLSGGAGEDALTVQRWSSATVVGGEGVDTITSVHSIDSLLIGGSDTDFFDFFESKAIVVGGEGADFFTFRFDAEPGTRPAFGTQDNRIIIRDFDGSADLIHIIYQGFTDQGYIKNNLSGTYALDHFLQHAHQSGHNTVYNDGLNEIILGNTQLSDLSAWNFQISEIF